MCFWANILTLSSEFVQKTTCETQKDNCAEWGKLRVLPAELALFLFCNVVNSLLKRIFLWFGTNKWNSNDLDINVAQ